MNITFVTLFLGLVTGTRDVQVAVGGPVVAVELRLDGALVARLGPPAWKAPVDFGSAPAPHDLEAVAFDAKGNEGDRARIRVNLPRPRAEASFVIERPDSAGRQVVHLTWECAIVARPRTIRITLDGDLLDVEDPSRFEIPPGEAGQIRSLRADLKFGHSISAVAEAFLGSHGRDYTSAELTAVAVVLTGRKELPPLSGFSEWFLADGRPLRVVAAEKGPADVVFLVDPEAEERLVSIARKGHWRPLLSTNRTRENFRFEKEHLVSFVLPAPEPTKGTDYVVFPQTGPFSRSDGGLLWLYFRSVVNVPRPRAPGTKTLRDGAALTGIAATQKSRRRAVVWILSSPSRAEHADLCFARLYLQALNVPLAVWRVSPDGRPAPGLDGEVDASTPGALDGAISLLEKALDRQRIVWVEGRPLPQRIVLTPKAEGIELAR